MSDASLDMTWTSMALFEDVDLRRDCRCCCGGESGTSMLNGSTGGFRLRNRRLIGIELHDECSESLFCGVDVVAAVGSGG